MFGVIFYAAVTVPLPLYHGCYDDYDNKFNVEASIFLSIQMLVLRK